MADTGVEQNKRDRDRSDSDGAYQDDDTIKTDTHARGGGVPVPLGPHLRSQWHARGGGVPVPARRAPRG